MNVFKSPSSKPKKLYTAILLLTLAAIVVTILLIIVHYESSALGSFCKIDDYWNCDKVNKSTFAEIFGIPIAIFGFGYYAVLALLIIGLMKGFDFQKNFSPLTPAVLLKLALAGGVIGVGVVLYLQLGLLTGPIASWAVLKAVIFLVAFIAIYKYSKKNTHPIVQFNAFLTIYALFGVLFSLYLTDIELFVLQAICVYCFTQQILILIIAGLSIFALSKNKNELPQPNQS